MGDFLNLLASFALDNCDVVVVERQIIQQSLQNGLSVPMRQATSIAHAIVRRDLDQAVYLCRSVLATHLALLARVQQPICGAFAMVVEELY